MARIKRLQIKVNDNWEYVYCCSEFQYITTKNPELALKVTDLEYFKSKFENHEFRITE